MIEDENMKRTRRSVPETPPILVGVMFFCIITAGITSIINRWHPLIFYLSIAGTFLAMLEQEGNHQEVIDKMNENEDIWKNLLD